MSSLLTLYINPMFIFIVVLDDTLESCLKKSLLLVRVFRENRVFLGV